VSAIPSPDPSTSTPAIAAANDPPPETAIKQGATGTPALKQEFTLEHATAEDPRSFPHPPSRDGRGPPSTVRNTRHLLNRHGINVRYDVIKKKCWITLPGYSGSPDNFDNVALTHIVSLASLNGMNTASIPAYVEAIGDQNLYNPVAEWIHSKPWDGISRLDEFYNTLVQKTNFPESLKRTLMRRWALSAAAAALKPHGFHGRGVLTLQGPQSIGKTAWARALVSDEALRRMVIKVDHHLDGSNKDTVITAVTHWIVEIGELDSSFKKDVARLKGFLTADCDKLRRPYAKGDSEYQRRTVFCASVNEETFLVDTTGNTRWWTIPVTSVVHDHGIDMQQFWAQVAIDFESGEQWWLTKDEEQLLEAHNMAHRTVSAIREGVLEKLNVARKGEKNLPWMTASRVLKLIGIDSPTNAQSRECGTVLRELLGEPKERHGSNYWRVPVRISDVNAPDDDDEDIY
jgi:hypothetical protein